MLFCRWAFVDRQYILSEIRRTAIKNGGLPLGRSKFRTETGIKDSDWSGKIWARWSDAVREAGFEPNQMQVAYDGGALIEKFISLMRELGHFPVRNEMRLKTRNDPDFPNEKTFGSRGELIARIREYCERRPEYGDVLEMCAQVSEPSSGSTEAENDEVQEFGFVYLLRSGRHYKIGRSNATGRREYELKIQLPERATMVHEIRTDDPAGIEAYWHKRFEAKRLNGEWFDLTNLDVSAFRRRKFM